MVPLLLDFLSFSYFKCLLSSSLLCFSPALISTNPPHPEGGFDRRWAHTRNLPATCARREATGEFGCRLNSFQRCHIETASRNPLKLFLPGFFASLHQSRCPCSSAPLTLNCPQILFFFHPLLPWGVSFNEIIPSALVMRANHCEADRQIGGLIGCRLMFISLLSGCPMG